MNSSVLLDLRNELVESSHFFTENPVVLISATFVCMYFCVLVFRLISKQQAHQEALQIMVNKRYARDEVVHKALLAKAKNTKRFIDATELLFEYKAGTRTCVDALLQLAHASHTIGLHSLSATTEEFYDEALAQAECFDKLRNEQGELKDSSLANMHLNMNLLAGVPVSIKDNFHMKGADSTIGIACRCFKPKDEDGLLVAQLRSAGAVPFVKSNIPPLLLMPESDNKVWGTCKNPWDLGRTPGGSSGGEAALIASGCSLLGLGGDIGGSIRIPATYCGVVGFKPSYHRVTKQGVAVNRVGDRTGQHMIVSSAGPMARSVRDCALMMEVLTHDLAAHDYTAPPLVWNKAVVEHGLLVPAPAPASASVHVISVNGGSESSEPVLNATVNNNSNNSSSTSNSSSNSSSRPQRRSKKAQESDMAALKAVIAHPPPTVVDTATATDDATVAITSVQQQSSLPVGLIPKKQRVAVMITDGWCDPVPAVKRAVEEAADVLRAQGYEVVPFQNPIDSTRLLQVYLSLMSADGNWHFLTQAMEGEDLSPSYNTLKKYTDFPTLLRPPVRWLLQNVLGEKRRAALFGLVPNGGSNVRAYWDTVAEMKDMERAYQSYFREEKLDALLMPTLPMTAPPHGMAPDLIPVLTYTFLANLLHWPAGVIPVTCVRSDEQVYDIASLPVYQQDGLAKMVQKVTEGSVGSPVGVQIMTPMWHDENCLHIMSDIESKVNFTSKHRPSVCADTV